MPAQTKIAIIIGPKGRGSNMLSIASACKSGDLPASVSVVVSPKADTPAVEAARAEALDVQILPPTDDEYAAKLLRVLSGSDWICLAGYLRLLPVEILNAFPNRILNIHPALLPKFGGKGMYGSRVHEAVLASGDKESGCTVHFVTENYDEGAIVHQRRCPVLPNDTPETLAARVLEQEHIAYVEALGILLQRT